MAIVAMTDPAPTVVIFLMQSLRSQEYSFEIRGSEFYDETLVIVDAIKSLDFTENMARAAWVIEKEKYADVIIPLFAQERMFKRGAYVDLDRIVFDISRQLQKPVTPRETLRVMISEYRTGLKNV